MNIPNEVSYNGGIAFRYYPGGVECEITFTDENGIDSVKAFIATKPDEIEKYDRSKLSEEAYQKAKEALAGLG